jgi:hypothetical protein
MLLRASLRCFHIETAGRELGGTHNLPRCFYGRRSGDHALGKVPEYTFVARCLETLGCEHHPSRGVISECDGTRVPFPQQFQSPLRDSLSRSRLHEPECGQPAIVPGICIDIVLEHSVPAPTCAIEYALFPVDLKLFLGSSRARITRCSSQLQQRLNRIADRVGRQLRYRRFGLVHQVEIRRQVVSYRAQNRCRYFLILRREISDLGVRRVEKSRHSRLDLFTRSFEVGPPIGCQRCGLRNCRSVAFLDLLRAAVEGSENAENQNKETCSRHNLHSIELRRDQKSDLIVIQHDRVR